MGQITELLGGTRASDDGAQQALFAAAYDELKRLARARLRDGGRNAVLDTTSLVHEAYLRFVRVGELRAGDRRAFFAYASRVMRSILPFAAVTRTRLAQPSGSKADSNHKLIM